MILNKYFLAANGYSGFRSYFDYVFKSENFKKIYVLKGGPGTGKSSLMRKIGESLAPEAESVEEIYCSSDTNSLDGIIISKKGEKIAIMDGTAPHERDAKVPGAIDEIVDLSRGWDKRLLLAQREKILELNKEKASAYKTAYSFLSIAGKISDNSKGFASVMYKQDYSKFQTYSKADCVCKENICLISSFGKTGYSSLNTLNNSTTKTVSIRGNRHILYFYMNDLLNYLKLTSKEITRFPSPFDDKECEAILVHDTNTLYKREIESDAADADECFIPCEKELEKIKKLDYLEKECLGEAQRWFNIASDFHFRLEKIYSSAMDFKIIDAITDEILTEIRNILQTN